MNGKTTKVTLACDIREKEFEVSHAERLLAIPNCGWWLPKNSKYEYKDGSIRKRPKKGTKGVQETQDDKPCDTASE